jgi:hypothetical protein
MNTPSRRFRIAAVAFLSFTACQLLSLRLSGQDFLSYDKKQIKAQIREIIKTCSESKKPEDRWFMSWAKPGEFEKVILFLQKPVEYFSDIQKIQNVGSYVSWYWHYLMEIRGYRGFIISDFLEAYFWMIDEKGVQVLTFMLENCSDGVNGEIIAGRYIDLFAGHPQLFINDLKTRKDWRRIIDGCFAMDPNKLKAMAERLGDSEFEREFKRYVFAQYGEFNKQIPPTPAR